MGYQYSQSYTTPLYHILFIYTDTLLIVFDVWDVSESDVNG